MWLGAAGIKLFCEGAFSSAVPGLEGLPLSVGCCSTPLLRGRTEPRHRLLFNNMERVLVCSSLQLSHPDSSKLLLQTLNVGYFLLGHDCRCWFADSEHKFHLAQL